MNKSLELQNQLRQSVFQTHESIKNQKSWEKMMKDKEQDFIKQKQESTDVKPPNDSIPIRSKVEDFQNFSIAEESLKKMSLDDDNKAVEEQDAAASRHAEALEFKDKGNTFVKGREYEKAIKMYSRAIDLYDQDPVFYSNRSQCYLSLEKFNECIEDTNKALALDPKSTKSYYRQTVAYEHLGEDLRALSSCRKWLDLSPEDKSCNSTYDRIHNRIIDAEKKKDKEKIRWSRLGSDTKVVNFVTKPPHLSSKRPLKNVPVRLRRAHSPIPESVIDKIFGNNTGETLREPETDSKLFKPNFLSCEPAKKVAKLDNKAAVISPPEKSPKLITPKAVKQEKMQVDTPQLNQNAKEVQTFSSLKEIEDLYPEPIAIPSNGPKFFIAWEQLDEIRKFLLLKKLAENHIQIGKLTGAQLDSKMLSEIISIAHKYFKVHQVPYIEMLAELGKNPEVLILSMFLEEDEKKNLRELLDIVGDDAAVDKGQGDSLIKEIRSSFQI